MKTITKNQHKAPVVDPYLSPDNLESIADSFQIVAAMPTEDALTALEELRSVWRRDAMGAASVLLKNRDRAAFARVFALVLEVGKCQN